jgi:hypothetical protein
MIGARNPGDLEFDARGWPAPGIHEISIGDLQILGKTAQRQRLTLALGRFVAAISSWPEVKAILLYGSFASKKEEPNDVDVAVELHSTSSEAVRAWVGSTLRSFSESVQHAKEPFDVCILDSGGKRLDEIQWNTRTNPPQRRGVLKLRY